jgi:putative flippase GtrA
MAMVKTLLQNRFVVYVAGGVLSAAIDIGAMQMLRTAGLPLIAATTLAFVAGLLFNYAYHARVTFAHGAGATGSAMGGASFARYLCVVAANYLVTIALVSLGDTLLGSALAGKLASLPMVAGVGYVLGKLWIFK